MVLMKPDLFMICVQPPFSFTVLFKTHPLHVLLALLSLCAAEHFGQGKAAGVGYMGSVSQHLQRGLAINSYLFLIIHISILFLKTYRNLISSPQCL